MRKPVTDAYAWYRAALAGEKPPMHLDEPECGFFKRRLVKGGPWVAVKLWREEITDPETGELLDDSVLCCDVDGRACNPDDHWSYVASQPITEKEFQFLTKLSKFAKKRDPREPLANPRKPIDLFTVPAPLFQAKRKPR